MKRASSKARNEYTTRDIMFDFDRATGGEDIKEKRKGVILTRWRTNCVHAEQGCHNGQEGQTWLKQVINSTSAVTMDIVL